MKKMPLKKRFAPEEPSFGQSLIEIAQIIGPEFNYKKTLIKKGSQRVFPDQKGIFREMVFKRGKNHKPIAE